MMVRVGTALIIALLAHAGAYAIIIVSSPKKADIQIQGGSISISLMPTDEIVSDESDAAGEDANQQEEEAVSPEPPAEAPLESAPEPEPEPLPEPEPEPAPEPLTKPTVEPDPIIPLEKTPEPEPESQPEPEAEPDLPNDASPADESPSEAPKPSPGSKSSPAAEPIAEAKTSTPADAAPNSGHTPNSDSSSEPVVSNSAPINSEIGNAAQDNYNGALMRHMRKARKFDTNARRSSKISITIDAHGNVLDVNVIRASGDKTWDRRVVKELKRIAPYPVPPSGSDHSWTFDAVPK